MLAVTGTATTVDATLSGAGDVRLDALAARDTTAAVSGTGSIVYTGNPTVLTKNVTGTGAISEK